MAGIYILLYFLFPIAILWQTKRVSNSQVLLEKEDTEVVKGIATCFVIFAHLVSKLQEEMQETVLPLNIFTVMGGMGVLLFFFVSGYGIYRGYAHKKATAVFWHKRLVNMYLPCVGIQFLICITEMYLKRDLNMKELFLNSFFGAWFIDVIMIQYICFFAAWIISKGKQNIMIIVVFLLSIILASVFWINGFNERWYNGLLLFPVGMLTAWKEQELRRFLEIKWAYKMLLWTLLFCVSGGVFVYWKGELWANMLKVASGICLCLLVVTIYRKIKISSYIMKYMGERSLYFYLVHLGLMSILENVGCKNAVLYFYGVFLLSFLAVEFLYRLYTKGIAIRMYPLKTK